ncbi:hypothetical protein G6F68_014674 [Rhizopus microsporus]|nr:hypothetical protein G6F68_014674 [Rhizopus microsporus]
MANPLRASAKTAGFCRHILQSLWLGRANTASQRNRNVLGAARPAARRHRAGAGAGLCFRPGSEGHDRPGPHFGHRLAHPPGEHGNRAARDRAAARRHREAGLHQRRRYRAEPVGDRFAGHQPCRRPDLGRRSGRPVRRPARPGPGAHPGAAGRQAHGRQHRRLHRPGFHPDLGGRAH